MGGIIGALFVGLALVVYLLMNNQGNGNTNVNNNSNSNNSNNAPIAQATSITDAEVVDPNAAPTTVPPPRMPLEEFKALYDDPARRPLIVDVRAAEAFQQGHIQGAVNIPEAELASRVAEFPKDKLVVAYCQ
jgi:3-mercaptopyruvate sulfurtransferase SseA